MFSFYSMLQKRPNMIFHRNATYVAYLLFTYLEEEKRMMAW